MVKILWRNNYVEEISWKPEAVIRKQYPHLFSNSSDLNFEGKIPLRGVECDISSLILPLF